MKKTIILLLIISINLYSFDFKKEYINQLSWSSFSANLKLKMIKKDKSLSTKEMLIKANSTKKGQNILAIFKAPSNLKGMAFLANCNKNLKDKRYIYLRALRRVKRVPANAENYMLRDFLSLYLLKPRVELWNFKLIEDKDNKVIVEATAKNKNVINLVGYKRLLHYIDKEKKIITKTEFFGKDNSLRRVQTVTESKIIDGVRIITKMRTNDKEENLEVEVILEDIKLNKKISNKIFTTRYLKTL